MNCALPQQSVVCAPAKQSAGVVHERSRSSTAWQGDVPPAPPPPADPPAPPRPALPPDPVDPPPPAAPVVPPRPPALPPNPIEPPVPADPATPPRPTDPAAPPLSPPRPPSPAPPPDPPAPDPPPPFWPGWAVDPHAPTASSRRRVAPCLMIARTGTASCMPRGRQRQFSRSGKIGPANSGRFVAVPQEIEATLAALFGQSMLLPRICVNVGFCSDSGTYFAGGTLIGSTLSDRFGELSMSATSPATSVRRASVLPRAER